MALLAHWKGLLFSVGPFLPLVVGYVCDFKCYLMNNVPSGVNEFAVFIMIGCIHIDGWYS